MREEILRQLRIEYAMQRQRALDDAESRLQAAYAHEPELGQLQQKLTEMYMRRVRRVLSGDTVDVQQTQNEVQALQARMQALLKQIGMTPEALEPKFRCSICQDTGQVGDVVRKDCKCFTQKLLDRLYSASGLGNLRNQNFDTFNVAVFSEERMPTLGISQRQYMQQMERSAREYAERFPENDRINLLLYGKTGLGKTFLLNCIAQHVLKRGYTALRLTAFRMLECMREYHLGDKSAFGNMLSVDLLVIDDLGSEPMIENITIEYLFTLLNERIQARRHTLFATNLELLELQARYAERVSSRLMDVTTGYVLHFEGGDIRTSATMG